MTDSGAYDVTGGLWRPRRVLFLCADNTARSQIAEALLSHKGGSRFLAASAGPSPGAHVDPHAVRALREWGIDWSGARPKGLEAVAGAAWDQVVTLCDRGRERCPELAEGRPDAHWGVPDPAECEPGADAFRATARLIAWRIDVMLAPVADGARAPGARPSAAGSAASRATDTHP